MSRTGPGSTPPDRTERRAAAIELVFTVILALAAVGTAWAGFQSAKWSGVQANSYAEASAARVESSRLSTEASQLRTVDVITFTQWLNALNEEILADSSARPDQAYEPTPGTVSGLLYERFRDEFRPAVEAWVALRPLVNPDVPKTPFQMPEYRLASEAEAGQLLDRAEGRSADARAANQRSDCYNLLGLQHFYVDRARSRSLRQDHRAIRVRQGSAICGLAAPFGDGARLSRTAPLARPRYPCWATAR